ncbi:unnamed protein product [Xylocopa violacea]|uniref:Uncharacterized protein n=1 Tax=Xylocopa violacea TaxID=135666 RepID=A0ABP1NA49_XYLVO
MTTDNECVCPRCLHPTCPHPDAAPPYDEVTQEIDDNFVSVKIPKNTGRFDPEFQDRREELSFDFNCADSQGDERNACVVAGERCKSGCNKIQVIPDQRPPTIKPGEEVLSLKAIRHLMPNDDLKNTLEIEFKAPRNYIPLPEPGPEPPIIIPKQSIRRRRGRKRKRQL